jgi:ferredoxin
MKCPECGGRCACHTCGRIVLKEDNDE